MTDETERLILDKIAPELRARGYEVLERPIEALLPVFFGAFRPDAIALRGPSSPSGASSSGVTVSVSPALALRATSLRIASANLSA